MDAEINIQPPNVYTEIEARIDRLREQRTAMVNTIARNITVGHPFDTQARAVSKINARISELTSLKKWMDGDE